MPHIPELQPAKGEDHFLKTFPKTFQVSRHEQILVAHAATTTGAIDSANTIDGGETTSKLLLQMKAS